MHILNNHRLWFVAIVIYPWLFVWQGFDMTDMGFSLSLYSGFFVEGVPHGYVLWLTNLLGGLWDKYFDFLGVLGFKIAFILNIYLMLYMVWVMLKAYDRKNILMFSLFVTIMFITKSGGNWVNYNHLSSLFYITTIFMLYMGYKKDNLFLFAIAGFVASANILIRFPNILNILLLLSFVLMVILYKRKIFKYMMSYIIGFTLSIVLFVFLLKSMHHYEGYIEALAKLFQLASDKESTYSSGSLLKLLIRDYLFVGLFTSLFIFFIKYAGQYITSYSNYMQHITIVVLSLLALYILPFLTMWKWIYIGVIYITIVYIVFDKKESEHFKLLASLALLFLGLIPLGSGNGIYNAIYGLWLAMPLMMVYYSQINTINFYNKTIVDKSSLNWGKRLFVSVTILFSLVEGYLNTQRDTSNRLSMVYTINHPKLKGVYTTEKRAKVVEEFLNTLEKRVKDRELFVYEKIAMTYYLLEKVPPLSHVWAVGYMTNSKFKKEFELYTDKVLPVIARSKYSVSNKTWPYTDEKLLESKVRNENRKIVESFMKKNNYKLVWENAYFEIWDYDS